MRSKADITVPRTMSQAKEKKKENKIVWTNTCVFAPPSLFARISSLLLDYAESSKLDQDACDTTFLILICSAVALPFFFSLAAAINFTVRIDKEPQYLCACKVLFWGHQNKMKCSNKQNGVSLLYSVMHLTSQ